VVLESGDNNLPRDSHLAGLPALSVPFTFSSEQLPINVQLVSRWLDEATILRLGALIEARNKAQHRHPNL
jgi:aspartyl-tRNA(Asn)/glutamyl-tRNA(Gln) amidotransferase subunit A